MELFFFFYKIDKKSIGKNEIILKDKNNIIIKEIK